MDERPTDRDAKRFLGHPRYRARRPSPPPPHARSLGAQASIDATQGARHHQGECSHCVTWALVVHCVYKDDFRAGVFGKDKPVTRLDCE
jgi:hypothetical protein